MKHGSSTVKNDDSDGLSGKHHGLTMKHGALNCFEQEK